LNIISKGLPTML